MHRSVVVNGSPRMEEGHTAFLLDAFVQGLREAGSAVEVVQARRLDPSPCQGEFHCWYVQPGECLLQDEMQELYPRLRRAQLLVLATPVYVPLPGEFQNLLNRLIPLMDPVVATRGERTRARLRPDVELKQLALVSTCGWWELENFDTVVRIAEEFSLDAGIEFAGAVLRPHAEVMRPQGRLTPDGEAVLQAAGAAGRELIAEGRLRPETLERIRRPLIGRAEYLEILNAQL